MAEQSLAELICSPMDSLEEIILNENSSIEDLEQILPVLDDIINSSKSLSYTLINRIKRIKFAQLDKDIIYNTKYYPTFYTKGEKIIENKYMMSKFYGLPFMRQREAWPKNEKGNFLKFLCQIIHPNDPNILYRIFIHADEDANEDADKDEDANAMHTILPIELATAKWLKGTAMAFKDMPYNSNEYIIKEWAPYKELKEYKYIQEYISEEDYYHLQITNPIHSIELMPSIELMNIHFGEKLHLLQLEKNNILLI